MGTLERLLQRGAIGIFLNIWIFDTRMVLFEVPSIYKANSELDNRILGIENGFILYIYTYLSCIYEIRKEYTI